MLKSVFRTIAIILSLALLLTATGAAEGLPVEAQSSDAATDDIRVEAVDPIMAELGETALLPDDGDRPYEGVPAGLELGVKEKYTLKVDGATFKSSDRSVATVNKKGVVKAKKVGFAAITVTVGGAKVATCDVTVLAAPKKVKVEPKKLTMHVGETYALEAVLPDGAASRITWSSGKKSVAKVDELGNVTAVSAGKAKITATTYNGKKATCTVTVKPGNEPTDISFEEESITLGVKESATVTPYVNEGADAKFTFATADKAIATVSKKGVVKGRGVGETTITATTQNGLTASLEVYVRKAPSNVTLDISEARLAPGETLQLTATLSEGSTSRFTWASSDATVAIVEDDGLVTALAAGTATVTVSTYNSKKASCAVTVVETAPESSLDDFEIKDGVITKYVGAGGDVVIPSKDKDGKPITAIGRNAFYNCDSVLSVSFPNTVTTIGYCAFSWCDGLTSIDIPSTVTRIVGSNYSSFTFGNYDGAFCNCANLKHVTIPSSITTIENALFAGCKSLESMTIPVGVTEIGAGAFRECESLREITIPDSVVTIGDQAFCICSSLTEVIIPDSVVTLGITKNNNSTWIFDNCMNLKKATVGEKVQCIGGRTFTNCTSLERITIKGKDTTITGWDPLGYNKAITVEVAYGSFAHKYCNSNRFPIEIIGSQCEPFDVTYGGGAPVRMDKTLEAILATADSDRYNPDLAHVLMVLSAAAYNDVKSTDTGGSLLSAAQLPHIGSAYINLGFDKIVAYNYYDSPYAAGYGADNVAYTVGVKTLVGGHRIVLVTVRGSWSPEGRFDTSDWISNVNMNLAGEEGLHPGFNAAAESVMAGIRQTVGDLTDANTTFVLTGHSRGAAVANLTAVALHDAGVSNDRVFDYNFACPDVGRFGLNYGWTYGHTNIFNLSYTADPVGVVPGVAADLIGVAAVGTAWGKYGNTFYFTDAWDTPDEFDLSRLFANPSSHSQALYVQMMANRSDSTFHSWSDVAAKRLLYFTLTDSVSPILKLIEYITG